MSNISPDHAETALVLNNLHRKLVVFEENLTVQVQTLLADAGKGRDAGLPHQHLLHGLAWYGTTIHAFGELARWMSDETIEGEITAAGRIAGMILAGELLSDCINGIAMHQLERIVPQEFSLPAGVLSPLRDAAGHPVVQQFYSTALKQQLIDLLIQNGSCDALHGFEADDETLVMADQVHRFGRDKIVPNAQSWHLADALVPDEIIAELGALGLFGVSMPESFGGSGASKAAMCAVTEELSRAYLAVGSLGTRSEIAAELIYHAGTPEQKARYLPGIASGQILPTAAFTEPEAGSDLAAVRTRAIRDGDDYVINGSKIWITHAARTDLMTLLVRTNPDVPGFRGLSMLLVDKPRGDDNNPFPLPGMSGSEIEVIGYRGMKEYEIGFQDFRVPASALLGVEEGKGFYQLMRTFETARIQTAARSTGVTRAALDEAFFYAQERRQFGRALIEFPRVANKIIKMYTEVIASRLLTLSAVRAKEAGRRCDLEAGMAKLYAARAAWSAADGTVQIFGGNGFSMASPASRILCDARVLSIFEGASEIQADIIARRMLEESNS